MKQATATALGIALAALVAHIAGAGEPERVIGLLGAFDTEVELLDAAMTNKETVDVLGIRFTTGILKGQRVVLAESGVGKVNAAMTATALIDRFRPAAVIFSGIAGGLHPELRPGDIIIAEKAAQHDYGSTEAGGFRRKGIPDPVSGKRNPLFFLSDPALVASAEAAAGALSLVPVPGAEGGRVPRIVKGVVVTGDVFVATTAKRHELRTELDADAVEMEGGAVAQVCHQLGVPFLLIRSLSDNADETAHIDLERFYRVAAENSARLVIQTIQAYDVAVR
ncbi:MAG TPA: 5'-methylthioadenosine/adenosylhomocysteine nucleosidase [Candidatus Hydrogenedentes bacterium]|nr:5'-methylthioadenosine/adenosylhomocysteine nucleosidase [Candidatus Hydrogenedentota bacterium]HPG65869.1 5'-methylthioadenosine/adenosylhomocysteine nucleosidase [Candidatus Hydrogenedentota bacterium]